MRRRQWGHLMVGATLAAGIPKGIPTAHADLPRHLSLAHAVGDPRALALVRDLRDQSLYSSHAGDLISRPRSPGSLIKLLTAEVALQQRVITPAETLVCPGWRDFADGTRRPCWDPRGHGHLTLTAALAHSCNVFFYQVGERLGAPVLRHALAAADLGSVTTGQAPLLATGDDPHLRVTPLGLLAWLHRFLRDPHNPERNPLHQGMIQAVAIGTCQGLHRLGGVAAKTGTIKHQGHYQGWVAAYTPIQAPRWLILVHVPTGRASEVGIPVAQRVLTWTQRIEEGDDNKTGSRPGRSHDSSLGKSQG